MNNRTRIWLENVLRDSKKMVDWLTKQYHGEVTAAGRIRIFAGEYCEDLEHARILEVIASQEEDHANWVASLLHARGIEAKVLDKNERYWEQTLPGIESFRTGAAVAAHAEHMRLVRIRAIVDHPNTPADIRDVFAKILPQEVFHAEAFSRMAGAEALEATRGKHEAGLEALGLTA
ncbi:MAG: hypothetical protein ABA06_04065 [Parcubacteria bacterium C7867-001]|nr:MAG: hypothetical protein ABA06_04065 [Parcubacteria bacterium C7867-001]